MTEQREEGGNSKGLVAIAQNLKIDVLPVDVDAEE